MIKVIANYFHLQSQTILYTSSCTMPKNVQLSSTCQPFSVTHNQLHLWPCQPPQAKMAHQVQGELAVRKGDKSQLMVMSQRSQITTPQHCGGCRGGTHYSCSSAPFKGRGWQKLEMQDVVGILMEPWGHRPAHFNAIVRRWFCFFKPA